MSKFRVLVTRDVTESAYVMVEAGSEVEAEEKAVEFAHAGNVSWGFDVDSAGKEPAYVTGIETMEETNDA